MTAQIQPQSRDYYQPKIVRQFKYIHIWASTNEIRVQCTDPQTLQILRKVIEKMYPDCQADTREDLANQVYIVKFSGLEPDECHQKIAWWLFKMMCEQGWEPMETGDHWYKMKFATIMAEPFMAT
jgi:hypothetical protein